jgi:hypothetical protein
MDRRNFLSAMTGLMLTRTLSCLNAGEKNPRRPVIVEAGRRLDAADATVVRFPPQNVPEVREKIRRLLEKQKPVAIVSSAACGADLLLLDVAGGMNVPCHILLPSNPEDFRVSSVTDRPGDWGELYSKALHTSEVEVLKLPEGQEGYLDTNLKLLDRAQALAKKQDTGAEALVVWNQVSRGSDDVTGHFLEQARLRKIPILEISTV